LFRSQVSCFSENTRHFVLIRGRAEMTQCNDEAGSEGSIYVDKGIDTQTPTQRLLDLNVGVKFALS
jgi:hypothetical protein